MAEHTVKTPLIAELHIFAEQRARRRDREKRTDGWIDGWKAGRKEKEVGRRAESGEQIRGGAWSGDEGERGIQVGRTYNRNAFAFFLLTFRSIFDWLINSFRPV